MMIMMADIINSPQLIGHCQEETFSRKKEACFVMDYGVVEGACF